SEPARRLEAAVAALPAVRAVLPFQAVRTFRVAPAAVLPVRAAARLVSVRRKSRAPPGPFAHRFFRVFHWTGHRAPPASPGPAAPRTLLSVGATDGTTATGALTTISLDTRTAALDTGCDCTNAVVGTATTAPGTCRLA